MPEQTDSIFDSEFDAADEDHKMDGMESVSLGVDMAIASDFGSDMKISPVGEVDEADAGTGAGAAAAAAAAAAEGARQQAPAPDAQA